MLFCLMNPDYSVSQESELGLILTLALNLVFLDLADMFFRFAHNLKAIFIVSNPNSLTAMAPKMSTTRCCFTNKIEKMTSGDTIGVIFLYQRGAFFSNGRVRRRI